MATQFHRNFIQLEKRTRKLFSELQRWPSEMLYFRPTPNSWSALEVLDHLRSSERGVLASMRVNLHSGQRISFNDRFRNTIVLGVMLLPTRVKVPAADGSTTSSGAPLALPAIQIEWEAHRKTFATFLDNLTIADEKVAAFRHPVGGWTTVNGALLFLRSHLQHHSYQLARIQRKSKLAAKRMRSLDRTAD